MTDHSQISTELAKMDFPSLVASPLLAVIEAQGMASIASADFIVSNAFEDDGKTLRTVTMEVDQYNSEDGTKNAVTFNVPLLTLMNAPNMRVEEYNYNFLAKINAIESESTTKNFGFTGSLDLHQRWRRGGVRLKAGISHQKTTSTGAKIAREYQMDISVKATSDQLPGGTKIMLEALQQSILSAQNVPTNSSGSDTPATS